MLLTVKEAAVVLTISDALVYALCASGKLRHERFGVGRGTIRIPVDAIEEYRRRCSQGGQEVPCRVEKARPGRHLT
jgi:excisionase family DNA binding protein